MRALIIDNDTKAAIRAALEQARKNPRPLEQVQAKARAIPQTGVELHYRDRPPGDQSDGLPVQVLIPVGFRLAVSYEYQPLGLCLHISISDEQAEDGETVPFEIGLAIAGECGIPVTATGMGEGFKGTGWVEEFEPGRWAVNIVMLVEECHGQA